MKLSLYFGFFEKEFPDYAASALPRAVLGAHYVSDGRLFLPQVQGDILVVDDSVIPEGKPEKIHADGFAGVFFDFERPRNAVCEQIITELSPFEGFVIFPPNYCGLRDGLVSIPQVPVNNWERFCEGCGKKYPGGWCIELRPVAETVPLPCRWAEGIHKEALVEMAANGTACTLRDTRQTMAQKLSIAEEHGCRLGIGLYAELKTLLI